MDYSVYLVLLVKISLDSHSIEMKVEIIDLVKTTIIIGSIKTITTGSINNIIDQIRNVITSSIIIIIIIIISSTETSLIISIDYVSIRFVDQTDSVGNLFHVKIIKIESFHYFIIVYSIFLGSK